MKGRSRQEDAAVKETIDVVKEAIANPNEVKWVFERWPCQDENMVWKRHLNMPDVSKERYIEIEEMMKIPAK